MKIWASTIFVHFWEHYKMTFETSYSSSTDCLFLPAYEGPFPCLRIKVIFFILCCNIIVLSFMIWKVHLNRHSNPLKWISFLKEATNLMKWSYTEPRPSYLSPVPPMSLIHDSIQSKLLLKLCYKKILKFAT